MPATKPKYEYGNSSLGDGIATLFVTLLFFGGGAFGLWFVASALFGSANVGSALHSGWDSIRQLDDFDKQMRDVVNTIDLESKSDQDFRLNSIEVSHRKVTFNVSVSLLSLRAQGITEAQWREAIKAAEAQTTDAVYHNPNTDSFEMIWVFNDEHGTRIGKTSAKIFLTDGQDFSNAIRAGTGYFPVERGRR